MKERHVALMPLTDDCVQVSVELCVLRCFLRGLGEAGSTGGSDGVEFAHQRTSCRMSSKVQRIVFWTKTCIQWFQLHVRALFSVAGTVEVAASLADKHSILDCFNELMCFADMLRV